MPEAKTRLTVEVKIGTERQSLCTITRTGPATLKVEYVPAEGEAMDFDLDCGTKPANYLAAVALLAVQGRMMDAKGP